MITQRELAEICVKRANEAVALQGLVFSLKEEFGHVKEKKTNESGEEVEVETPIYKAVLYRKRLGYKEEPIQELSLYYTSKKDKEKAAIRDSAFGGMLVHIVALGLSLADELYKKVNVPEEETAPKKAPASKKKKANEKLKDTATNK